VERGEGVWQSAGGASSNAGPLVAPRDSKRRPV